MGPSRPPRRRALCPICRKAFASASPTAPFCSERCKMVDLGRWFRGEYVVAGEAAVAFDPDALGDDASVPRSAVEDAGEGGGPPDSEA